MDVAQQMLINTVNGAIEATSMPADVTEVCKNHDGIRVGVNALLMCKKDDLESKAKESCTSIKLPFGLEIKNLPYMVIYNLFKIAIITYGVLVLYGKAKIPGDDIIEKSIEIVKAASATTPVQ